MSSPTPGPWKAGSKSVTAPETDDRLPLDVRIFGGNGDDNRANARLIALAPELLAIAQKLAKLREGLENGNSSAEYAAAELARTAAAVVAKATGDV